MTLPRIASLSAILLTTGLASTPAIAGPYAEVGLGSHDAGGLVATLRYGAPLNKTFNLGTSSPASLGWEGEANFTLVPDKQTTNYGGVSATSKESVFQLGGYLTLGTPVSRDVSVHARLGYMYTSYKYKYDGSFGSAEVTNTDTGLAIGIGATYQLANGMKIRGDYTDTSFGDMLSVSAVFGF